MRALRRVIGALVVTAILLALGFALYAMMRNRPQDLPWTRLDLSQQPGMFTGRKLAALTKDFPRCRGLLDRAGVRYSSAPSVPGKHCGYSDGVRLRSGGASSVVFSPSAPVTSCAVAAGMMMWEWDVLQPAAIRHFGSRVARIEHLGSYNCRRMYGRAKGPWSEHATADAIDIAGFVLSDGTHISVAEDWQEGREKAAFLHQARDGACNLFATVLSPDYNAAHHNHLHFDQADRGALGWRACR
ncbi:extensin family protein [Stakelama marina]|uniref:Extensin family protein n=1 Tax=Stakelama marina TaxID=2826939 RepID=A0A8T4IG85_9SPHN|nr:extensin family protein [Stakelama marina]MBR0553607.1 extensin family protein [Stakelama marina]